MAHKTLIAPSVLASDFSRLGDEVEAVAAADLITGAVSTGSHAFDVTKSLQAWASGTTNYGWAFKAGGTDGWDFYSSEGAVKPLLTVTFQTEQPPPSPTVSIKDGTPNPQIEGPNAKISFTVSLDQAATQDVVVSYATVDGTATAASDFFGTANGTLTFAAGETAKTIDVLLRDDALAEDAEAFTVKIGRARVGKECRSRWSPYH